jgi:hypothetical protein
MFSLSLYVGMIMESKVKLVYNKFFKMLYCDLFVSLNGIEASLPGFKLALYFFTSRQALSIFFPPGFFKGTIG